MSISRRDFLNGVALTIAAGLTPAAQIAAQPARYPPALTGLARSARRLVRDRARAGARAWTLPARGAADRGALRPGRGRRAASAGLPPPGSIAAPPDRRRASSCSTTTTTSAATPSATSSRSMAACVIGYGGSESINSPRTPLQRRRQGAAARPRRRGRAVRDRVRAHALFLARAVARRVLCARGLRTRRAGGGRAAVAGRRRAHAPPRQRQAAGRARGRLSDLGCEQGAVHRAL